MASTARLPKQFWRVVITAGADKMRMYEKKSATYAAEHHAQNHLDYLRNRGVSCDLYTTGPVQWTMVDQQPELDGQDQLF